MRERDVNLSEYAISPDAYRELKYFCYQYREKKRRAERAGAEDLRCREDCAQIERCARAAAGAWGYRQLMRNVTDGVPYKALDIPCGKNQFTRLRRRFFFLLANEKGMAKK